MAIQALPATTIRILNSSQVLTTPASLVKELIDNALDAKASSIDILISSNTLDKIEVRDNGHGIAADDLNVLGRRGYTSKLRSFEELSTVAGKSLGFRGEALASAVELGDVTITTRSDGEAVATAIILRPPGLIFGQSIVSHPVGTTVSVVNFLAKLPVRKQAALKESKKTLSTIRHMLQSYALARVTVRLQFKVLNATKSNWSCSPRPNGSIREVVSQVISPDTAAQCMEKTSIWDPGTAGNEISSCPTETPCGAFIFQAFIPKPNADFSRITGGHHVSIDSRPVSCARGPLKKLVALYKVHIRAAAGIEFTDKLKNPFIRVNIVCPRGSYDPNLEPAKDDVIFAHPSVLLASTELWLKAVYGDAISARSSDHLMTTMKNGFKSNQDKKSGTDLNQKEDAHRASNGLLNTASLTPHRVMGHISPPRTRSQQPQLARLCQTSMREDPTQTTVAAWWYRPPAIQGMEHGNIINCRPSSPSQISGRLFPSAPINQKRSDFRIGTLSPAPSPQSYTKTKITRRGSCVDEALYTGGGLQGDINSSIDLIEDLDPSDSISQAPRRRSLGIDDDIEDVRHSTTLNPWMIAKQVGSAKVRNHSMAQPSAMPDNFERTVKHSTPKEKARLGKNFSHQRLSPTQPPGINKEKARAVHVPISSQGASPQQLAASEENMHPILAVDPLHRALVEQYLVPEEVVYMEDLSNSPQDCDPLARESHHDDHSCKPRRTVRAQQLTARNEAKGALEDERCKESVIKKTGLPLRAQARPSCAVGYQTQGASHMVPSQNISHHCPNSLIDKFSEVTEPRAVQGVSTSAVTSLPDGDPRAYLIRRQKSLAMFEVGGSRPKLKRTRTMLLPLESIAETDRLNTLLYTVSVDIDSVRNAVVLIKGEDGRLLSGKQTLGFSVPVSEYTRAEKRIHDVVGEMLRATGNGEICDVDLDLTGLQGRHSILA